MIFNSQPNQWNQKLHTFLSLRNGVLWEQMFPASSESSEYSVMSDLTERMQLKDITEFVTCVYDFSWWLGSVLSVGENTK
jgi:hypothetical protein